MVTEWNQYVAFEYFGLSVTSERLACSVEGRPCLPGSRTEPETAPSVAVPVFLPRSQQSQQRWMAP